MGTRDSAHEQDDRHDHEPWGDHGCSEADLTLAVEDSTAGGDEHEREGAEHLGEQPPPLQTRIIEIGLGPELEGEQVLGPRTERTETGNDILRDGLVGHHEEPNTGTL